MSKFRRLNPQIATVTPRSASVSSSGRAGTIVLGLVIGVALVVLLLWQSISLPHRVPANEPTAVGSLRTLNTAAIEYQSTYKNGFPPTLQALAQPPYGQQASCTAADLIESTLASGKKAGYLITYTPGPTVKYAVAGCPRGVEAYTLSARPVSYGKTGVRSFFTDQSAIIRGTSEDRAATVGDPELQ